LNYFKLRRSSIDPRRGREILISTVITTKKRRKVLRIIEYRRETSEGAKQLLDHSYVGCEQMNQMFKETVRTRMMKGWDRGKRGRESLGTG